MLADDYVNLANLKVWHPHFTLNFPSATGNVTSATNDATLKPATANDLCNPAADVTADVGSAGGSVLLKHGQCLFLR
jgi:hypothetical protein